MNTKNNLLTARKETINELRSVCDQLESKLIKGKYAQNEERTKGFTIAGKAAGAWTFNLIEATGEAAHLANAHYKRLFTIKQGQKFQLTLQDEPEIKIMEATYQELIKLINKSENNLQPFINDYRIYEVMTNIWVDKIHIDVADMKDSLSLLVANSKLLEKEIQNQEKIFQTFDHSFALNVLEQNSSNQQVNQLEMEVKQLRTELVILKQISSEKLISKNLFNKEKITRERELLLEKFLTNPNSLNSKEIELLEKKLTKEILIQLRQLKQQLNKKEVVLTNLQNNQLQLLVLQQTQ